MFDYLGSWREKTRDINVRNALAWRSLHKLKVGQRLRDVSTATKYSFKPILLETLFCHSRVIRYLFYVTRVQVIKDKNVKNVSSNVQNVTCLH